MGVLDQLNLLLWKNYTLQKRRTMATVIELLVPALFSLVLLIVRSQVTATHYRDKTTWKEFTVNNLPRFPEDVVPPSGVWTIAYVPNTSITVNKVMRNVEFRINQLQPSDIEKTCGFDVTAMNTNGMLVMSPPNLAQTSNQLNAQNTQAAAVAAYGRIPPPLRLVLDGMANKVKQTPIQFVEQALKDSSLAAVMAEVEKRYTQQVKDCLVSQIPAWQREYVNLSANGNATLSYFLTKVFGVVPRIKLISFDNERNFLRYAKNDTNSQNLLAGVVFEGYLSPSSSPVDVTLTLRFQHVPLNIFPGEQSPFAAYVSTWRTRNHFSVIPVPGPREKSSFSGGSPNYYKEGFLTLQHALYMGIASVLTGTNRTKDSFALKRYPYPPYIEDAFILVIQQPLPSIIMLSFFYTALVIIRSVVQEKESRMKEYMMMMGLANWLHWAAWFIKYILLLSISCFLMTVVFHYKVGTGSVFTNSDPTVTFVFLVLFSAATIAICFLFTAFFSKANDAAAAGGVLYGITYMPYIFVQFIYDRLSRDAKLVSSLLPNMAMGYGCQIIAQFEGKGAGVQWSTLNEPSTVDDNLYMSDVFWMLCVDTVLYTLLAVYVEAVLPGDYGIPKPWYFPLTISYWCGATHSKAKSQGGASVEGQANRKLAYDMAPDDWSEDTNEFFEEEPKDLRKVVEIEDLKKVFKVNGKTKTVVNNLCLNMYEGQVNVLLGHNGAGKTTTMSILTGLFPPTSGDAYILGQSISKDMSGVRKSLGFCPQFNILFDHLTVDEHLYFFGRIKGLDELEAEESAQLMRRGLKLDAKANFQSRTLSGGMKRKLSVGIALCAGSKCVILDEPTAGMDPAARRAIWDVIQQYRRKCSILLSTHFMDEADILGDRIAIMAEGKIRCAGSPLFLKNKFGIGYHVILTKTPECDVKELERFFRSIVKESKVDRVAGGEVSFVLPFHCASSFAKLFRALELAAEWIGVIDFGATVTTLEEVFLSVTQDSDTPVKIINRRLSERRATTARRKSTVAGLSTAETQAISRWTQAVNKPEYAEVQHIDKNAPSPSSGPALGAIKTAQATQEEQKMHEVQESQIGQTLMPIGKSETLDNKVGTSAPKSAGVSIDARVSGGFQNLSSSREPQDADEAASVRIPGAGRVSGCESVKFRESSAVGTTALGVQNGFGAKQEPELTLPTLASVRECRNVRQRKAGDSPQPSASTRHASIGGSWFVNDESNSDYEETTSCCYSPPSLPLRDAILQYNFDDLQGQARASFLSKYTIAGNKCCASKSRTREVSEQQQNPPTYNTGAALWFQQYYALTVKRALHSRRNYKVAISQLFVPVGFMIFASLSAKYTAFQRTSIPVDLSLEPFGRNTIYYRKLTSTSFVEELIARYKSQVNGTRVSVVDAGRHGTDLDQFLSDKYEAAGGDFNSGNLISALFDANRASGTSHSVAWFNAQGFHTSASSLAYLQQAYLRAIANRSDISINLVNHPLERSSVNRIEEERGVSFSAYLIAFNLVLGFSFLAASLSLFLVRERVDRSSLLQTLAGVDPFCFWFSAFVWDFINCMIPCLLSVLVFAFISIEELAADWAVIILIFALYCFSSIPLVYLLSFFFSVPSAAMVRITILMIITGMISIISITLLRVMAPAIPDLQSLLDTLDLVFLFVPQYCLAQALSDIYSNHRMIEICTEDEMVESICAERNVPFQLQTLAWPEFGVGRFATMLAVQGAFFFLVLFLYEFHCFAAVKRLMEPLCDNFRRTKAAAVSRRGEEKLDEDVQAEKDRINDQFATGEATDQLVIKNLTKVYGTKRRRFIAVNDLCLGIPKQECFGLLGINGAGKTTTFKMLTGDHPPSSGTAYLDGFDIKKQMRQVQRRMGYCPQFDGLIEQMTGAETLRMFARLRGVPEAEIPGCIAHLGDILQFSQHMDKSCGTYSGGNKRKLSTAIALVGNPSVVLLDEPSTGMDPGARRMLWNTLSAVRNSGCSIVITSHSMEECEALCTRLAIMVNGQFRCLGGLQHLKSRFGQGYTIEVKIPANTESSVAVRKFMRENFPGCIVKDESLGYISFLEPRGPADFMPLSSVFELMEKGRETLAIKDYTVTQTTLEQVFLSLVRFQRSSFSNDPEYRFTPEAPGQFSSYE